MKTAKLGALFLISVLALAGIGVGYAHWTDTINITGTVNTGSVSWEFECTSGTWGWKNTRTDLLEVTHDGEIVEETCVLVGEAYGYITDDHTAGMKFINIFPGVLWHADLVIHYTGSVPGKVNSITVNSFWPTGEGTIDWITEDIIYVYDCDDILIGTYDMDNICGVQLHYCYTIEFVLEITIPNDNAYQGLGPVYFDVDVEVINWNEYSG